MPGAFIDGTTVDHETNRRECYQPIIPSFFVEPGMNRGGTLNDVLGYGVNEKNNNFAMSITNSILSTISGESA